MTGKSGTGPTGRWTGLLLVALAGTIWGTIGPTVRLVHGWSGLSALSISAYRAVAAVVALVAVALITRRLRSSWSAARRQWRRVLAVGVLTAAFQLLFFIAVLAAGVSVATVVCLGFAPVLLLVLDSVRRRRWPAAGRVVPVTAAVLGLVLVSVAGGSADQAPEPLLGILAALGSGAAWAVSAVIAKPLSQRVDSFTVTTATLLVAAVLLIPGGLVLAHLRGEVLVTTDPASWLAMVYLGVVTMCVAYAVFFTGLRHTSSGTAMVATLIEPVTAVLIAVAVLGERLTVAGLIGCLLILTAIASLGRQSETPPA